MLMLVQCINRGGKGERERKKSKGKPLTNNHRVSWSEFITRVSVIGAVKVRPVFK